MARKKATDATRLWDKGEHTDELMRILTVGEDPELDRTLVRFDAIGSAAHARMLAKCGYLNRKELRVLLIELRQIEQEARAGLFVIPYELEDMHTAIEMRLTKKTGATGERIHTARSRNDQILMAVRLYLRDRTVQLLQQLSELLAVIEQRFKSLKRIMMPGYTHLQPAMPSSVGLWLHAWYEGLLECARDGHALYASLNSSPLGAGAGFGSSLKIDREYVAGLLKFDRVQRSVIDVNNSRGRYEERFLRWICDMGSVLEKCACDLMLYTTREYGFFRLPSELTTGSSIMPQKRNADIVELLRGRASLLRGFAAQVQQVSGKLPSSYHRDFQLTKGAMVRGSLEGGHLLSMASLILSRMEVNRERLQMAMYPDLYATYDANREVGKGVPFREAYRRTAARVARGEIGRDTYEDDFAPVQQECERHFVVACREQAALRRAAEERRAELDRCYDQLWRG